VITLPLLKARHPWPDVCPEVPEKRVANGGIFGWFHGENRRVLKTLLERPATENVLELGALLGLSTSFLAQWAPTATIVTIDHWRGSREHQKSEPLADVLDTLFETFCVHMWRYRENVIPVRDDTLHGMVELYTTGFAPDVVYVDASHETGPVYADTMLAITLWPNAHIVGDDGKWTTVQAALKDVQLKLTDRTITNHGCCWEIPPAGTPVVGLETP